jgi:hypothetical protein
MAYITIFLVYIYFFNIFQNLEINTPSASTIRLYRDFALLALIPQFVFAVIATLRGIGFDIKKFNFSKDLQELSINIKDSEEVEVMLAKDTYKYMRGVRKVLREIRYIMLESKFALSIVSGLLIAIVGLFIFLNIKVYNKTYKEFQNFYADTFNINVLDSYLTTIDYKGKTINKNKYYVILKLKIKNNNTTGQVLDLEKYRLVINNKEYLPMISKLNYFLDLGESYTNQKLLSGKEYIYIFTYEVNKEEISNNYIFRIMNEVSLIKGEIKSNDVNIKVKPTLLNIKNSNEFDIQSVIDLSESTLKNSQITINSYNIAASFSESYKYCINDKCNNGITIIKPEVVGNSNKYVLKLDTTYNIKLDIYILKYISNINNFMDFFASINYNINGVEKTSIIKAINSKYTANNIAFLEVPEEVTKAEKINIILTIRNIIYKIKLK